MPGRRRLGVLRRRRLADLDRDRGGCRENAGPMLVAPKIEEVQVPDALNLGRIVTTEPKVFGSVVTIEDSGDHIAVRLAFVALDTDEH